MFRLSHHLRQLLHDDHHAIPSTDSPLAVFSGQASYATPAADDDAVTPAGPVVIWNLLRRCNLSCRHCYSLSADVDFPGELRTHEIFQVMDDLKAYGVQALIFSGGEPLLRPDIFTISERARTLGFHIGLSTNGSIIDDEIAARIRGVGFHHVGISLDGIGLAHDRARRRPGAYRTALAALRSLRDHGVTAGVRFTMTQDNAGELPAVLDLVDREGFATFSLSHHLHTGRGHPARVNRVAATLTRNAIALLIDTGWDWAQRGRATEITTSHNDADAVYFLQWAEQVAPKRMGHLRTELARWGGNASGLSVANIDNVGNVHPDTMWWHYTLGNVKKRPFSAIWSDLSDPIMAGLKRRPRLIGGRCGACHFFDICGGNTRVRALRLTGDPWAEDPGCYLNDAEIGIGVAAPGLAPVYAVPSCFADAAEA